MRSKHVLCAVAMMLGCSVANAAWIKAGTAPFELALDAIVPQPYKIELRANVPANTMVTWTDGDNWMQVLRDAIAPLALDANHDIERNVVVVTNASRGSAQRRVAAKAITVNASDTKVVVEGSGDNNVWTLSAGLPIHTQLNEWAQRAGWSFAWRPERTWLVPADATFTGSFDKAISAVIQALFDQGKGVRLALWEGNKFAEVTDVNVR